MAVSPRGGESVIGISGRVSRYGPCVIWLFPCLATTLLASGCGRSSDAGAPVRSGSTSVSGRSQLYRVPTGSMEPTLPIGARVVVKEGPPAVGAIVVYHPPEGFATEECGPMPHVIKPGGAACDAPIPKVSKIKVIKRIVAGPGDELYVRGGHVYRKADGSGEFVRERDSYIRGCGSSPECDFPVPIRVPSGYWFLMGITAGSPTTVASGDPCRRRGLSVWQPTPF